MKRFKLAMVLSVFLFGAYQENNLETLESDSQNSHVKERLWMVKMWVYQQEQLL